MIVGLHYFSIPYFFGYVSLLPDGVAYPEGIARNSSTDDIYVSSFNFSGNNKVLRYNKSGKLPAQIDFAKTPLLGLAFNPADEKVYICNTGDLVGDKSRIQRVVADFSVNSMVILDDQVIVCLPIRDFPLLERTAWR